MIVVSRAFKACSKDQHLKKEIRKKGVLRDVNGYPN